MKNNTHEYQGTEFSGKKTTGASIGTRCILLLIIIGVMGTMLVFFSKSFIKKTVKDLLPCNELTMDQCQKRDECRAIFSKNSVFQDCITLTSNQLEANNNDKRLCEVTGGAWKSTEYGMYCDCSIVYKRFRSNEGCK